jgi:hypothetical protein
MSCSPKRPDWLHGPSSLVLSGYRGSLSRVKRLGLEGDQFPPPTVLVKNAWCYTSVLIHKLKTWIKTSLTPYTRNLRIPIIGITQIVNELLVGNARVGCSVMKTGGML